MIEFEEGVRRDLGSESSLELADGVLFFDCEPVSSAPIGAGVTVQLEHLAFSVTSAASSLFDCTLELDTALDTTQFQHDPDHFRLALSRGAQAQG